MGEADSMIRREKGLLLVLSGPSGAGKGTLASLLLQEDPSFRFSVSVTTRNPRQGEIPDVHYHFVDDLTFDALASSDAFIEYASVHGHRYGTLKSEVMDFLNQGVNVLLDIDVQGAKMVMERMPDAVSVFIMHPPSASCASVWSSVAPKARKRLTDGCATRAKKSAVSTNTPI